MSNKTEYQKQLQKLDNVLNALFASPEHKIFITDIDNKVIKTLNNTLEDNDTHVIVDTTNETNKILNHLGQDKHIEIINHNVHLTYNGILKLANGGYTNEQKNKSKKDTANYWFWILAPIFSGIIAILGITGLLNSIFKWW